MRKFTNPKAIKLIREAEELEKCAEEALKNKENGNYGLSAMMTEAAGLRALADDIEDGLGMEEEEEENER